MQISDILGHPKVSYSQELEVEYNWVFRKCLSFLEPVATRRDPPALLKVYRDDRIMLNGGHPLNVLNRIIRAYSSTKPTAEMESFLRQYETGDLPLHDGKYHANHWIVINGMGNDSLELLTAHETGHALVQFDPLDIIRFSDWSAEPGTIGGAALTYIKVWQMMAEMIDYEPASELDPFTPYVELSEFYADLLHYHLCGIFEQRDRSERESLENYSDILKNGYQGWFEMMADGRQVRQSLLALAAMGRSSHDSNHLPAWAAYHLTRQYGSPGEVLKMALGMDRYELWSFLTQVRLDSA